MKTARSLTWGLAVTCLSLLLSLAYLNTLGDDSFIYRRLIENFLQSGRIEYNPGEPCYAMTSATYFFLMSALTGGFGWNIARYLISPLSHLFAAWALFGLGSRLIRRRALLVVVLAAVLFDPVSYTHLDVYKRQRLPPTNSCSASSVIQARIYFWNRQQI